MSDWPLIGEMIEDSAAIQRARVRASLRKRRIRLREQQLCVDCGKRRPGEGRALCAVCLPKHRHRHKERVERELNAPEPCVDRMMEIADRMYGLWRNGAR